MPGIHLLNVVILCVANLAAGEAIENAELGRPVKDFKLRDLMKEKESYVSLSDFKDKKTVVLVFVSYNCNVSWRYEKRIGKLFQDFRTKDVAFVAVRSSALDTVDGIRKYAEAKNLDMPLLYDERNLLADYLQVRLTPTFFVIDKSGNLRYQGSFDDDMNELTAKASYLRNALEAVIAGKEVARKKTTPFG